MAKIETLPLIVDQRDVVPSGSAKVTNVSSKLKANYVQFVSARAEDAIAAADSSQVAFQAWSRSLPRTRRNILLKTARLVRQNAAELINIQVEETNCPEMWAGINVEWAALHLEEMAGRITTVMQGEIPARPNTWTDRASIQAPSGMLPSFLHAEQSFFSTERVIVHAAVFDKFVPILVKAAQEYPILEAVSSAGPTRTLNLLKDAVSKGAKVVYGQVELLEPNKLQPVIISHVTADMEISDEESFGPVLAVYSVSSEEEAIRLANDSKYGLAAGVYNKDIGRALQVASQLEVGQTHINFPMGTGTDEATLSVGISKGSGCGRQNGGHGLDAFLELRTVTITSPADLYAEMQSAGTS